MAQNPKSLTRRRFLTTGTAAGLGVFASPLLIRAAAPVTKLATRPLGRTGFPVATIGLGGQASLQWTPAGIDPVEIIVRAYQRGVNYFDTSNVYDKSQLNFGMAFRQLGLVSGQANYDESKRRGVFVASKTMLRMATGPTPDGPRVEGTQGRPGSRAVDDLKRTLTQVFGDGNGAYPEDAYLDLFQIHNLNFQEEVDAIYIGLKKTDSTASQIGTLAALRDYRDGTNLTGLNPNEERRIRHIGITGHFSSPVLIECIQRDEDQLLDTLLVAINANDRLYFNHQFNAIPVAAAKGMGIIAMKVFADGALVGRKAEWNHINPEVIQTVGSESMPSTPLVQYSLSTPGVSTAIIGIGRVDKDAGRCQLQQNLSAAQLDAPLDPKELQKTEQLAASVLEGRTNYFQRPAVPLGAPRGAAIQPIGEGGNRGVRLSWHMAFAADAPITHYSIERDGREIAQVPHRPQVTKAPFTFDGPQIEGNHRYSITTVDAQNRVAKSDVLEVS
jgi:aryl-alcohol dehydrogenase-like predicted oxidoreductase